MLVFDNPKASGKANRTGDGGHDNRFNSATIRFSYTQNSLEMSKKKYTDKQKTKYTKMALALCGCGVDDITAEIIWRVHNKLAKHGSELSIMHTSKILAKVGMRVTSVTVEKPQQ